MRLIDIDLIIRDGIVKKKFAGHYLDTPILTDKKRKELRKKRKKKNK